MKKSLERFYPFIIFLFAILLYANTISNGYNMDDELVTVNHRTTSKGIEGIKEIFSSFYYEDDMGHKYGYRPITHLSFALEHEFFGESPQTGHLINVLLYAFLCLLIYFLINKIIPDKGPMLALIVALIFSLHPIHTEVVASIKNRDEILSLLFSVCALLGVLNLRKQQNDWQINLNWVLIFGCFCLSILSKVSGVTLIIIVPLFYYLFVNNKLAWQALIFTLMSAIFFVSLQWEVRTYFFFIPIGASVFTFLIYLLSEENRQQLFSVFSGKVFNVVLSLISLLSLIGRFFYENDLLTLTFFLSSLIVLWVALKKEKGFYVFAGYFILYALACTFTNNFDFLWAYWLMFLLIFESEIKKQTWVILGLIACSVPISLYAQEAITLELVLIYIFMHLSIRKWIFPAFMLLHVLLNWNQPFIAMFHAVALIILLDYFKWINLKILKKKFSGFQWQSLILIALVFAMLGSRGLFVSNEEVVNDVTISNLAEIEKQNVQDATLFEQDGDRPLLFMENPLVEHWDLNYRLGMAASSFKFYVFKLFFPYPLLYYYGYNTQALTGVFGINALIGFFLLAVLSVLSWFYREKKEVLFASAFFLASTFIYSNFSTPVAGIVAERLAFSASLSFALVLGLVLFAGVKNIKRKWLTTGFIIFLFVSSAIWVVNRNFDWKSKYSLFVNDIEGLHNSAQAHALVGDAHMIRAAGLSNQDEVAKLVALGEKHYLRALEIYPDFLNWWLDLGRLYMIKGDLGLAKDAFNRAKDLDPNYQLTYEKLTEIAVIEEDRDGIIQNLNILLFFNPNSIPLLLSLSYWHHQFGEYSLVIEVNDLIIDVDNSLPEAYLNKAFAYAQLEDWENFSKQVSYAELLDPTHADLPYLRSLLLD